MNLLSGKTIKKYLINVEGVKYDLKFLFKRYLNDKRKFFFSTIHLESTIRFFNLFHYYWNVIYFLLAIWDMVVFTNYKAVTKHNKTHIPV